MSGARFAFLAIALFALSSCQKYPTLYLINGSGRPLQILHADVRSSAGEMRRAWRPWFGSLADRKSEETIWAEFDTSWLVAARVGRCNVSFEIPVAARDAYSTPAWRSQRPENNVDLFESVAVEVGRDLNVYLAPAGARVPVELATVIGIQPPGLPIRLSGNNC